MIDVTARKLRCPACAGKLRLDAREKGEIRAGTLVCLGCGKKYPILAGVAILVEDVRGYLLEHVKGIARLVPERELPREHLKAFQRARAAIQAEHIEEDLEADRVVALYVMNHYLAAKDVGPAAPLVEKLVREHWDHGPLPKIAEWVRAAGGRPEVVELGCGVGGLAPKIAGSVGAYLGVDSSFASVAIGRHLALGVPYDAKILAPADLLAGPVSRELKIPVPERFDGTMDLVVGDLLAPPIAEGSCDLSIVLNAIDMLDEPGALPETQAAMLRPGGLAIQSCPYIWHEGVARELRERLPEGLLDSARAVEWLYQQAGFQIEESVEHLPWLFFKHRRQLEIYSVHLFRARR